MGKYSAFYSQISELGEPLGYNNIKVASDRMTKELYKVWDKENPILLDDEKGLNQIVEALRDYSYILKSETENVMALMGIFLVLLDKVYLKNAGEEPDV